VSGADWENLSVTISAKQSRAHAAAWLERRHREDWTAQDQVEFDAWLADSPAHMVAYVRVETAWKRADRLSVLRRPEFTRPQTASGSKTFSILFAIAGALAIAVLVGFAIAPDMFHSGERVYATGIGGRQIVKFADGTQIELNTNTVVRTKSDSISREAWLDKGEAYFRIAHDTKHPFVVYAGDRRVTDLGTRFLIRRDAERLEVALLEGKALFDAPNGPVSTPVILSPGDVITEKDRSIVLVKKSSDDLSEQLGWRRGMLIFKHTTLATAADEFNRYNTAKIVIADPATGRLTIGGTFQVSNIGVFARSMKDLLGVQIENRGNQTVISR
jgi:transmembrane sensor